MGYYDKHRVQPFRGDIFTVCLEGYEPEQKDYRPAIIISNNIGNRYSDNVIIVTCSTCEPKIPTHVPIQLEKKSVVMTERVYTVHQDRLQSFIRRCTKEEMEDIDRALSMSIGLTEIPSDKGERNAQAM